MRATVLDDDVDVADILDVLQRVTFRNTMSASTPGARAPVRSANPSRSAAPLVASRSTSHAGSTRAGCGVADRRPSGEGATLIARLYSRVVIEWSPRPCKALSLDRHERAGLEVA
jgi:hypothetical protein